MKASKVAEAYAHAKTVRDHLHRIGRCMEVTEDKAGILWERWLIGQGRQVVLMSTPHWAEVFAPVDKGEAWAETIKALDALAEDA
jgi:hypothetical protein